MHKTKCSVISNKDVDYLMRTLIALIMMTISAHTVAASTSSLIRQALETGSANGLVTGTVADDSRKKLNATGPLTLTVTRVYAFEQPDCGRLQLDFEQGEALLPGRSMPEPYKWSIQMNVCSDGQAPKNTKRVNQ